MEGTLILVFNDFMILLLISVFLMDGTNLQVQRRHSDMVSVLWVVIALICYRVLVNCKWL